MSSLLLVLSLGGCNIFQSLLNNPEAALADADGKLKAGDLAGAAAAYDEAVKKAPTNVDAASGAAYMKVLAGDFPAADALLAASEATAAERAGEVKLRRAFVAMEAGDLDKVKEYATASGLPAGSLLAGEVALADGDRDAAKPLFEAAKADSGAIGTTATTYLDLMADVNPLVAGLSEAQALWALGQRRIAVRSVEDLVKAYAESREDGGDQLLLWAGRAAAVGETGIAFNLLDSITVPPAGQGWRVQATRAMATCIDGDSAQCIALFDAVRPGAPADGYADARATAALAIAEKDPATAKALVEGMSGDAVARAYAAIGDKASAAAAATDTVLKSQLGG
jgi:thioredoxin-like negative regulator of GroEL